MLILALLCLVSLTLGASLRSQSYDEAQANDWLVTPVTTSVILEQLTVSDGCLAGFQCLTLSNGLISRRFVLSSPNSTLHGWATLDLFSHMRTESAVRSLATEAQVVLNGQTYTIGGLKQISQAAYWNATELELPGSIVRTAPSTSFVYVAHRTSKPQAPFPWTPGTRHSPKETKWPPEGLTLSVEFRCESLPEVLVMVHYEMYVGIPLMSKWVSVHRGPGRPVWGSRFSPLRGHNYGHDHHDCDTDDVVVEHVMIESLALNHQYSPLLFAPYPAHPPYRYVAPVMSLLDASTDQPHGAAVKWINDPRQGLSPGSSQPLLEISYVAGPGVHLNSSGSDFVSFRALLFVSDSNERERASLGRRRIFRTLAPTTLEAPLFFHLSDSSSKQFRTIVDQLHAVGGFDMIIFSFGSGFKLETSDEAYLDRIASDISYAGSRGIEVGGYDLICLQRGHGGYGGDVGPKWDIVLDPKKHTLGVDACFASGWLDKLTGYIEGFIEKTGLSMLETDGPYGGGMCAGEHHAYHLGLEDSMYHQERLQGKLYSHLRKYNVFINQPDGYFFQGGSKTGIGYNEDQYNLPRMQDITVTRATIYEDTYDKTFIPIIDYHGGGKAAAFIPLKDHLKAYNLALAQQMGAGVAACIRGPIIFDDPKSEALVRKWASFWVKHRPILVKDIIHLKRAVGRGFDAFMHVDPSGESERAIVMAFNGQTRRAIKSTLRVPLYYAGLSTEAFVRQDDAPTTTKMTLDRDYSVVLDVHLEPESVTFWTFSLQ